MKPWRTRTEVYDRSRGLFSKGAVTPSANTTDNGKLFTISSKFSAVIPSFLNLFKASLLKLGFKTIL